MRLRSALSNVVRKSNVALFVLLLSSLKVSALHAQEKMRSCPWLNNATAAGFLGHDVTLSLMNPGIQNQELPNGAQADIACDFIPTLGQKDTVLRIAVTTMQDIAKEYPPLAAQCGATPNRIVGVGNTAVGCALVKAGIISDEVIARVRRRAFVLSFTRPLPQLQNSPGEQKILQEKLQNLAEQIAGSLF